MVGASADDVRAARAGSVSTRETPQWLEVIGELPDGRRARMLCPFHIPNHVVSWRPLGDDQ